MNIVLAVAGTIIALTQAVIAIAVHRFLRRQDKDHIRQWEGQVFIQRAVRIHQWANDCLCALTEAHHFGLLEEADFSTSGGYRIRKHDLLHRLSALIDQGRLFFSNAPNGKQDRYTFPAHRGYRPQILDPLVATYRAVRDTGVTLDKTNRDRLYRWRGRFISLVQCEVDSDLEWVRPEYIPSNHGGKGGVALTATDEPPPWPEGRTGTTNA